MKKTVLFCPCPGFDVFAQPSRRIGLSWLFRVHYYLLFFVVVLVVHQEKKT